MHKYLTYAGLVASVFLALSGAVAVVAQTGSVPSGTIDHRIASSKYFNTLGTYNAANVDPLTKIGSLTISREDNKRGVILTNYAVNADTKYLKKYGGLATLNDFKIGEQFAISALRNADGSLTAKSVTNNNLWFLDPIVQKGLIISIDEPSNSFVVKDSTSGKSYTVNYSDDTQIQKPKAIPGIETDLVVGKSVRIRGLVRKTGATLFIEQANLIIILPEPGEQP